MDPDRKESRQKWGAAALRDLREAAAGIRILCLIFTAAVFLAAAAAGPVCAAAVPSSSFSETAENDRFTVNLKTDSSRKFTSFSRYYPVKAEIKNRGADFEGVLKLMLPVSTDTTEAIALGQEISIPADSEEIFYFEIPAACVNYNANGNMKHFIARADILSENGEQVFSGGFRLRLQVPDNQAAGFQILTGVITDMAAQLEGSYGFDLKDSSIQVPDSIAGDVNMPVDDQFLMEGSGYYSALQVMDPVKAESALLSGYSVMILDAPADAGLWEKLLSWVKDGGYLLAAEPYLKGISPAQSKPGQGYRLGYGKVISFPADVMTDAGSEKETETPSQRIASYEKLCREMLQDADIELLRDLGTETRGSRADTGMYDYDITDSPPQLFPYMGVLALYILLIGPALYFILKKRDRREYLWAAVPALSLAASIAVFAMGAGQRLTAISGETFSTVLLSEEGAVEHTLLKVVNPGSGRALFSVSPDYKAGFYSPYYQNVLSQGLYQNDESGISDPAEEDLPALLGTEFKVALSGSEGQQDILLGKNRIFTEYGLTLDRQIDGAGTLRTDLSCWKGKLYGSVENNTACDLKDAFVMRGSMIYLIGSIQSGETITLDGVSSYPFYRLQEGGSGTVSFCEDPQAYRQGNDYAVEECIRTMLFSLNSSMGGANVAGGFTEDYEAGAADEQFGKIGRLALLCSYTDLRQSGSSWMSSGPLWGTAWSSSDADNFTESDHMMYGTQIELLYQLKAGQKMDGLVWLNPDPELQIQFYNIQTNQYEDVMGDAQELEDSQNLPDSPDSQDLQDPLESQDSQAVYELDSAQLAGYINNHRQIRVKVTVNTDLFTSSTYMTPAFEIYGGDWND